MRSHRRLRNFQCCLLTALCLCSFSRSTAASLVQSLDFADSHHARIIRGNASLDQERGGCDTPGMLVISDFASPVADITVGEPFAVQAGRFYYLSVRMKPVFLIGCHGLAGIQWLDATGKIISEHTTAPVYTASRYPGYWEPTSMPVWMVFDIEAAAPDNACNAQVYIQCRNHIAGSTRSRVKSGRIFVDDVRVVRSPHIAITTDQPGNIVPQGTPAHVCIHISDMPDDMPPAVLQVVLRDFDNRPVESWSTGVLPEGIDTVFPFRVKEPGYYELHWRLDAQAPSVRSGTVAFGIVPDFGRNPAPLDLPFALDAGLSWAYTERSPDELRTAIEAVRRIGVRFVRDRMNPAEVRPKPDVFEWGRYRRTADLLHTAGIQLDIASHAIPAWLSLSKSGAVNAPPSNLSGIYQFFNHAARDMGDVTDVWESWNEAEIPFFSGRPEEFAGLQKAAYLGLLAGNPNLKVTSNAHTWLTGEWSTRVYENGAGRYFDILNLHYYGHGNELGLVEAAEGWQRQAERFGLTQPWWMTEMGVPAWWDSTGSFRRSEIEQAERMIRAFILTQSLGFERHFYFYMNEFLETDRDLWGIFRNDLSPKPAFIALAVVNRHLGDARYRGRLDLSVPGGHAYVFEHGNKCTIAAWAEKPQAFHLSWRYDQAVDIMGRPVTADSLGESPLYFHGVDVPLNLLTERPKPVREYARPKLESLSLIQMLTGHPVTDYDFGDALRKSPVRIVENMPLETHLTLCNFWDTPCSVRSVLHLPEHWLCEPDTIARVMLLPMEERILKFKITPRFLSADTLYTITAESRAAERYIAAIMLPLGVE